MLLGEVARETEISGADSRGNIGLIFLYQPEELLHTSVLLTRSWPILERGLRRPAIHRCRHLYP